MNQDNNQTTTLLLKAILATQILMLILFACSFIANRSQRAENRARMERYGAIEADYEKEIDEYKKGMADYKARLEAWQRQNAAYTNNPFLPPKQ
jgi:hypothetical protein